MRRATLEKELELIERVEAELLRRNGIFASESVSEERVEEQEKEAVMRWAGPVEVERESNKRDIVRGWRARVKLRESEET